MRLRPLELPERIETPLVLMAPEAFRYYHLEWKVCTPNYLPLK